MFSDFITALNMAWRLGDWGSQFVPGPDVLEALDGLFAEFPKYSWFSGFLPPTFPRYKDGKRV